MEEYSEIIQILLKGRGLEIDEDIQNFLNPSYDEHLHDPFLMVGMSEAVGRIFTAMINNEKVAIYSDFDADGIPAGVLLHDFFKKIGFNNFVNYIPHRHTEGYGFHKDAVEKLAKDGVSLIITVDVGITAIETVAYAKELGVDVIITDHHEPKNDSKHSDKQKLPDALAILNPKQAHCEYPFDGLCGAGVAYKLVQALIIKGRQHQGLALVFDELPEGWEKWLLDLVAISTVADMVPLVGENRTLVHWGLQVLRKSPRVGIKALCNKLRINQSLLSEGDIGFSIGPRINAASRMEHPEDAFNLLSTKDIKEAETLASKLESLNNKRKGSVAAMVRQAKVKIAQMQEGLSGSEELPNVIVTGDPEWSPALVGLAAGSIADSLGKVVCIWGREGTGVLKGSCRAGGKQKSDISVVEMFEAAGDALLYYGGHRAAGGFAVSDKGVHKLSDELNKAYNKAKKECKEDKNEDKDIDDIELSLAQINRSTFREFEMLAPYGIGNPKPIVTINNVTVTNIRHFGKEQNHIEIYIKNSEGVSRKTSKFFATAESFSKQIEENDIVDMLVNLEESSFAGRRSLELRIVDIV